VSSSATATRPRPRWHGALACRAPRDDAHVRLVCVPYAGGGPAAFRRWPDVLGDAIEVWTTTLPGRGGRVREPFATEWAPLTSGLADSIAEHVREPIALYGHSMGALIAYEVAAVLEARGADVRRLFVSARCAPDVAAPVDCPDDDEVLLDRVDRLFGGVPSEIRADPELVQHFAAVLRADLRLLERYRWAEHPPLTCPITVLAGEDDETVSRPALDAWSRHTRAGAEVLVLPGGHFFLETQAAAVLDVVRARTAQPQGAAP
jgi:surfactin synthase thioesterase subunit